MEDLMEYVGDAAPLVIAAVKALIVIVIGWIVAGAISGFVRRKVNANPEIDNTIGNFVASIIRWVILLVVLVAVLGLFGIEATSLVAMLGAATLAIGLALQGTLSDLAAGFMLILFRPYKLGDVVDIDGTMGTVKDINLFVTELATPDNIQIIVPNGKSWGAIISNYSAHETRRVQVVFGIDYSNDADQAMALILAEAAADSRIKTDPAPWVRVTNLGDSSVDITARVWVEAADFWDVKFALTKAVKEVFDKEGISIPYPHVVQLRRDA